MFKEVRHIEASRVRNLCIRENWYTRGDCRAYDGMLEGINNLKFDAATTENIERIAKDIARHSNFEKFCNTYGYGSEDMSDFICHIMYLLINECTETFISYEED